MGGMIYRCDGCLTSDDHPKVHYGKLQFHHDCAPGYVLEDIHPEAYDRVQEIVAAAKDGVHGDELRARIGELSASNGAVGDK